MKSKILNVILSLLLIIQLCGITAIHAEAENDVIIANPGFEDELTGWSANKETLYSADKEEKRSGDASLRIQVPEESKKNWNKISQTITVVAGKTYALSYYSKFVSGKGVHHINSERHIYIVPENEWTKHTEVFTAQSDTVTIGFGNYYGETVDFYVDDVEITEVDAATIPETVLNGGFENPTDGLGWAVADNDVFGISKTESFTGNSSLMIKVGAEQNASYSTYTQIINVVEGEQYQLGFYCKNVTGNAMVRVVYGKDKKQEMFFSSAHDWNLFKINFTAESDTVKVQIVNSKGNYDTEMYFDNFFLTRNNSEKIKNFGFEGGMLDWTANNAALFLMNDKIKRTGDVSLQIQVPEESKKNWNKISQTISVEAGKTYALSYYSKFVSGKGVHHIGNSKRIYIVPENEWTKHTEVFTAQSDTVTIGFGNYYGETVDFYIDDIEINEVSVPAINESIFNGDFENAVDGLGWTVADADVFGISENEKVSGNRALRLKVEAEQNKSYSTYTQTVKVTVGKKYQLTFYCKDVAGMAVVKAAYGNGKIAEQHIGAVSDWKKYSIDFTTQADTVNISIMNNVASKSRNELYFDDFELTKLGNMLITDKTKELSGNTMSVGAKIEKINYDYTTADVIVAIYDAAGTLCDAKIQKADFSSQDICDVSAEFEVNNEKAYNAVIYVWDSIDNMVPATLSENL